ncbi:hypothetical protein ULF88_14690 [Halopseudomonas pachastrellae]|nr:hypothetical protein [Halopseudomonas pachastrellae]
MGLKCRAGITGAWLMGAVLAMGSTMVLAEAASSVRQSPAARRGWICVIATSMWIRTASTRAPALNTAHPYQLCYCAPYRGFGAFVEADGVTVIGSERYNNATGLPSAKTQYPSSPTRTAPRSIRPG